MLMLKLMNQKLDFKIHSLGEATLKEVSLNREKRSLEEVSLVKTPYIYIIYKQVNNLPALW